MVKKIFYLISITSLILIALIYPIWHHALYLLIIVIPYIFIGLYDLHSSHNILRNYPVIGHIRYMFEFIRPEIQQYFVATNLSGRPYNREIRSLIYQRAKNIDDTHPFGTEYQITKPGYHFAYHSIAVKKVSPQEMRVMFGGPDCTQPYSASRINISAMSFGALGQNAVMALNLGAKLGHLAHNTGEGGISPYHLKYGGDLIWQIGTGYFGCRTLEGKFDEKLFAEKANLDIVKMIEIKISQGAKPSHGGVLPAPKVTPEIARTRGVKMGEDCISPSTHSAFSTPIEMMKFIQKLRELTHGKPIGFKLCIGHKSEFMALCKAMLETGITPDFITVDGAEGGTGAAPLEYTNRLGMPCNEAVAFVHNCLVGINLREKIRIIASGKIATGFDMITKIALGADTCNLSRPMLFSIGCIQALKCNTNLCPTGVTTQNIRRQRAIVIPHKAQHVANFHHRTMKSFIDLTEAMGVDSPDKLTPHMIHYRLNKNTSQNYADIFHYIQLDDILEHAAPPYFQDPWDNSTAQQFAQTN